jgi:hypothetical protein
VAAEVRKDELPKKSKSRAPRPLPPPLGGDEQDKDKWARELEITRAELDEMSPSGSLKVTTDIYGHWERAERKIQAAKMEDAFPV